MIGRPVLTLFVGDVVRLRRPHPCGGDVWTVDRLGADIGLHCRTCGRRLLIGRPAAERRIVAFVARGDGTSSPADQAADPGPSGPPP